MGKVTLTVEEYLDLVERAAAGGKKAIRGAREVTRAVRKVRKGKAPSGMSKALRTANKKAKLKSGKFRKGWNQSRMMKYAHKIRRK